jgi:hypothetical protein
VVRYAFAVFFLWLVFWGGWRVVWAKTFPHLPNATIAWMKEKHPGMVPASAMEKKDLWMPPQIGHLGGLMTTPGSTPFPKAFELLQWSGTPAPVQTLTGRIGAEIPVDTPSPRLGGPTPEAAFPKVTLPSHLTPFQPWSPPPATPRAASPTPLSKNAPANDPLRVLYWTPLPSATPSPTPKATPAWNPFPQDLVWPPSTPKK